MKQGSRQRFYMHEEERKNMPGIDTCGDFMPFYHEGVYHLYYLHKYCIYEVTTKDFVSYGEPRLAVVCGSPEEQDWHIGTGSVVERDGVFHFYYTGFNENNRDTEGKYEQVLMRAISDDLIQWRKDPSFFVPPYTECYGGLHWRDPQVFWNDQAGEYWMAVTTTERGGPMNRSGCTHIMRSADLEQWEHGEMIYAPRSYATHECHDIFQMGGWWYMVFSNYTRWWETRYRMAKSPEGPWFIPPYDDMFDGRGFYAAKTVSNGTNRYLVGWQAIRSNMDDMSPYQWGGSTLVHELVQHPDGTLGVQLIPAIQDSFGQELLQAPAAHLGVWDSDTAAITGKEPYGFGWTELGRMAGDCLIEASVQWSSDTQACGIMLHTSGAGLEKWCQVRLEPQRNRLIFDRSNKFDGHHLFVEERYLLLDGSSGADIKIVASGNIIIIYVNNTALATRAYNYEPGSFGLFIEHGEAAFSNVKISE
ncbi:glycoside hydrolase family protein [Paenibacillus sonchi]|uniref:hypothetical protein n=1 Tax=Paenibacillus sonchi TaxID=373687 RepID=UPI001E64ED63|nr:hypothetical protein [Paenibacillus sonchi]MCE3200338.1 hypothetical protein [Paenibacillus sonchi]